MKADFQKLSHKIWNNSFNEFWVKSDYFNFHWHYHPEIEICYVKRGRGKRIIGDNIANFNDGDLVLVGSNIPHSWITDELFNESDEQIEVYVIQFNANFFEPFNSIIEFEKIRKLIQHSRHSIEFKDVHNTLLVEKLLAIHHKKGFNKYLMFLEVLSFMSEYSSQSRLCSKGYNPDYNRHTEDRILKVCNYIHTNYKNAIKTEELAGLISMNPSAFCRFFKRVLGKTVIEYINELRIGYACNQLQNNTSPIYKIAFDAGFSSIAYFNKVFKRTTNRTPKQYIREIYTS